MAIILLVAVIFGGWFLLGSLGVPAYILPSAASVVEVFRTSWSMLLNHAGLSLLEILAGLGLGTLLGIVVVLLGEFWTGLRRATQAFSVVMQSVPMFAVLPLLILWMGHGIMAKITVVALASFFPVAASLSQGLSHCPPSFLDLAEGMRGTFWRTLWHIKVPASLPHLLSGLRIAAVHAPLTVIAADWIGSAHGLGYLMMLAHGRMQLDLMFAVILVIVALSVGLHLTLMTVQSRVLFWRVGDR